MVLRFPVNYVGITNGYSRNHQAIDLGWHNKPDESIYAIADGKVSKVWQDTQFGGGLTVTIEYNNGFKSDFKHLSKSLVVEGISVKQGQEVAKMGNTGWASAGTHLHYNLYKNGVRVNPLDYTYLYPDQEVSKYDKDLVKVYTPSTNKFKIGDKAVIDGYLYVSSNASEPSGRAREKVTNITRVSENTAHPYNTTGDLGWMDESSIRLYEKPSELCVGNKVKITKNYADMSTSTVAKHSYKVGNECYIGRIIKGTNYPYQLVTQQGTVASANTIGFANKDGIERIN